jgi:glycosyltransferase involved in cell wall biosynthesis
MSPADPLVSIVIPCYNYGRFLGEAIDSALNQTYRSVEVIVVDDGSTDDTAVVAADYPVRLVSQSNSGVCTAINAGVRVSGGEFVMRLDADDRLVPTYIEETLAALRPDARAHFAYTEVSYFGAERNYVHGSALMRRRSFDLVGGYDSRLAAARCEDWGLWLAFAERGLGGVLVRKPLLLYRQHETTSRNSLTWGSLDLWRRNLALAGYLQDTHRQLFAAHALRRRLARLPRRVATGQATPRFAALLVSFYAVMLCRQVLGFSERTQRCAA